MRGEERKLRRLSPLLKRRIRLGQGGKRLMGANSNKSSPLFFSERGQESKHFPPHPPEIINIKNVNK
jgi:hypothetical protein